MTTAAAPKKEPFRRVSGDEQATRLIALYKRAEKEISTKLLQAVMKAGTKKALSVRRLEQELKAVYKMLDELKKAGESVSVEMVTAAFSGGIRVARKQLEAAGVIEKGTIVAEMGGVHEKAMKVYSSMIGERLADVVTTAGRTTADIYRQLELDSILTGTVSGYETINSKIREMEKTGEAQGLVAFVDRSGREWNMSTYVEMLARTTVMKIHNEAVKNEFIAHGEDLVIISYHLPTCEMCKPWNGKIVSLTGATKDYPTMTEAEADGLFHPNCRHAFSLYIPDESTGANEDAATTHEVESEELRELHAAQVEEVEKRLTSTPEAQYFKEYKERIIDSEYSIIENSGLKNTFDEAIQRAAERLKSDETKLAVNIKSNDVESVLRDGRFKSLFEVGRSGGTPNKIHRSRVELHVLGFPQTTPPQDRPIYGYLSNDPAKQTGVSHYGDVAVVLKQDVKYRSSCTFRDSLDKADEVLAQPIMKVDRHFIGVKQYSGATLTQAEADRLIESIEATGTSNQKYDDGFPTYTEAQIFGRVHTRDIEKIIFTKGAPNNRLEQLLKDQSISWEVSQ